MWTSAAIADKSSITPKKFGLWTMTAAVFSPRQDTDGILVGPSGIAIRGLNYPEAVGPAVSLHDFPVFRVDAAGQNYFIAVQRFRRQHRGLRHRRGAVVHRGVGHLHAGQFRDHRLVFIDGLEYALAYFRLVRGVGRVKLGAGKDMAHDRRNVVAVCPGAAQAYAGQPVHVA